MSNQRSSGLFSRKRTNDDGNSSPAKKARTEQIQETETPINKLQESQQIIGFEYLARLPSNRLFQLFVDGYMHLREKGWKQFDSREPGCVKAFFKGFEIALKHWNQQMTFDQRLQVLLDTHQACTQGVSGDLLNIKSGKLRDLATAGIRLTSSASSLAGIKEFIENTNNSSFSFEGLSKPKLLAKIDQKEIDLIESPVNEQMLEKLYASIDENPVIFRAPVGRAEDFKKALELIDTTYLKDMKDAVTPDDELRAIIKHWQAYEQLHCFGDANLRVFIDINLNLELMRNGFPFVTLFQPIMYHMYSLDELVEVTKDAMLTTLFTIDHPELPIFGYNANDMPDKDKIELLMTTENFRQLLNELTSTSQLEKIDHDLHAGKLKFLSLPWKGSIELHRACALGQIGDVNRILSDNPGFINTPAPENVTTLFKSRTPLQIAAYTNQVELVIKLLEFDGNKITDMIVKVDGQGNSALNYAIETGNKELIDVLLKHDQDTALLRNNKHGVTGLHQAARYCHAGIFNELFSRCMFLLPSDYEYKYFMDSLLTEAARGGNISVINFLFERNLVDKNRLILFSDPAENNPFIAALRAHHDETFRYLFDIKKWPDISTFEINILLSEIIKNGNVDNLKFVSSRLDYFKNTRINENVLQSANNSRSAEMAAFVKENLLTSDNSTTLPVFGNPKQSQTYFLAKPTTIDPEGADKDFVKKVIEYLQKKRGSSVNYKNNIDVELAILSLQNNDASRLNEYKTIYLKYCDDVLRDLGITMQTKKNF